MNEIIYFLLNQKIFFEIQDLYPQIIDNELYLINPKKNKKQKLNIYESLDTQTKKKSLFIKGENIEFSISENDINEKYLKYYKINLKNKNFIIRQYDETIRIIITTDDNKRTYTINKNDIQLETNNGKYYFAKDERKTYIPSITREYASNFFNELLQLEDTLPCITGFIATKTNIINECTSILVMLREPEVKIYKIKRKNNNIRTIK